MKEWKPLKGCGSEILFHLICFLMKAEVLYLFYFLFSVVADWPGKIISIYLSIYLFIFFNRLYSHHRYAKVDTRFTNCNKVHSMFYYKLGQPSHYYLCICWRFFVLSFSRVTVPLHTNLLMHLPIKRLSFSLRYTMQYFSVSSYFF